MAPFRQLLLSSGPRSIVETGIGCQIRSQKLIREGSQTKCQSVVFDHQGGGGLAETTPLMLKYKCIGNIHYLVGKHSFKKNLQ